MRQTWVRNVTMVAVLAAACMAPAGAAVKDCRSSLLPGVDKSGNLSWDNGGRVTFTGTYKRTHGRLIRIRKGNVTNASHKNQKYNSSGLGQSVLDCPGEQSTTCVETYVVSKTGYATFTGGYKCVAPEAL